MSIQYFPENLDAILSNTKVRHFPISLSIAFLGPKQILGFLFLIKKNSLTYVSSRKFSRLNSVIENSRQ